MRGADFIGVSIGIAIGCLSLTHSNPTPKEITWEDVLTDDRKGRYRVITTEQLSKLHKEEDLLVVDTRQDWE